MNKWRRLCIQLSIAVFGYRTSVNFVPFQLAKPQFGYSASMGRDKRLPAIKFGPFHIWMMTMEKFELSIGADFRGYFHSTVLGKVYPNTIVWPEYKNKKVNK